MGPPPFKARGNGMRGFQFSFSSGQFVTNVSVDSTHHHPYSESRNKEFCFIFFFGGFPLGMVPLLVFPFWLRAVFNSSIILLCFLVFHRKPVLVLILEHPSQVAALDFH